MKIYEQKSGIFYLVAYTSVNFSEFSAGKSIKKKFKFTLLVKNYSPILNSNSEILHPEINFLIEIGKEAKCFKTLFCRLVDFSILQFLSFIVN